MLKLVIFDTLEYLGYFVRLSEMYVWKTPYVTWNAEI